MVGFFLVRAGSNTTESVDGGCGTLDDFGGAGADTADFYDG